jgi:hypothetical protein
MFPLGAVLFPGGVLPLRIFEVRYLDMIGKCHKAGAPFGVVALKQGNEVRRPGARSEVFHSVGTLATITVLETPQPGLMTIRCHGEQRFRIARTEQLKHGLWIADIQRLEDDLPVPIPDDLKHAAKALERVLDTLRARQTPSNAPAHIEGPMRFDDCGWLANRWCEILPVPLELKQRLMQLDNPLVRLELVSDILVRTGITSG